MNNEENGFGNQIPSASNSKPSAERRKFVASAIALATTLGVSMTGSKAAGEETSNETSASQVQRASMKLPSPHDQRKPVVAMLVHPGVTLLDLLGPQTVLAPSCDVHLVWKNTGLLETDSGIVMKASCSFDDCPTDLDVLFVPGGQFDVMRDKDVLRFLADRGKRAKYVTSVCGGSIVLGAAGLMRGYKATSHWAAVPLLEQFGAIPTEGRVVTDRNRISGGGVTAGIDFGLVLLAELLGEDVAKMTQLGLEYDPAPPFDCGTPKKAGPEVMQNFSKWFGSAENTLAPMCAAAARDMGKYTPVVDN
ncbi:MAG: DJ-1/PfpI family protein [Planctomycetota bacterium]